MAQEGDKVGHYQLVRQFDAGAMGTVFEAVHTRIRSKRAAVKVLHPNMISSPMAMARFEREAEAAASIGHDGIIDVYDFGHTDDGSPYLIMELLNGRSLGAELGEDQSEENRVLDVNLVVHVACRALSALAAAHEAGIVHRDLKPDNIYLVETDEALPKVKILDFGIAMISELSGDSSEFTLTKTGMIMGTPLYMSPEQAMGERDKVDQRTDIWSMGVVLYRCLTGTYPFHGENYNQLLVRIISDEPVEAAVINPAVPPALDRVIQRAIQKEPEDRYPNANEMLEDLRPLLDEAFPGISSVSGITQPGGSGAWASRSAPAASLRSQDAALASQDIPDDESPAPKKPKSRRALVLGLSLLLVLTLIASGGIAALWINAQREPPRPSTPAPAASTASPAPLAPSPPPAPVPTLEPAYTVTQDVSPASGPSASTNVEAPASGPSASANVEAPLDGEASEAPVEPREVAPTQPEPTPRARADREERRAERRERPTPSPVGEEPLSRPPPTSHPPPRPSQPAYGTEIGLPTAPAYGRQL